MEKKVSIKVPTKKELKINQFGKRVIENWCLYAQVLAKRKRAKEKKDVVVSMPTEKDRQVFKKAYRKMMRERTRKQRPIKRGLKRLASSRSVRSLKIERVEKVDDDFVKCPIDYKAEIAKMNNLEKSKPQLKRKLKSSKSSKSVKSLFTKDGKIDTTAEKSALIPVKKPISSVVIQKPPLKTKPWVPPPQVPQRVPKPVVKIPPFKTRPWKPFVVPQKKQRVKPVINYPPLKLRKT